MFHLLESIRYDAANDLANPESCIPDTESRRCFGFGVPLTTEKHERRCYCSLKDPKKDSGGQKGGIVMSSSRTCGRDSPKEHVYAEPFSNWDFLKHDA